MMNMCKKSLFLRAKATILLFLILAASATLVVATRTSSFMTTTTEFGGSSTYVFTRSNRPIQPSDPYPWSYLPGDGPCKPPKWCMLHTVHQASSYINTWCARFKINRVFFFQSFYIIFFLWSVVGFSLTMFFFFMNKFQDHSDDGGGENTSGD